MIDFTFISLSYNHEKYIIEHCESIKYLIKRYGSKKKFQFILSDDSSQDKTVEYVKAWVKDNRRLFCSVQILTSDENRGTCANFTRAWPYIKGKEVKLLAGDDVFSCENIFEEYRHISRNIILAGLPLFITGGELVYPKLYIKRLIASYLMNKKKSFLDMIKRTCVINTPSIIYHSSVYKDNVLKEFINRFKVIEDLPMWIKIGERNNNIQYLLQKKIYIYYRRTNGSTYVIKKNIFCNDKKECIEYLLKNEKKMINKLILRNRNHSDHIIVKRILNIGYYIYAFNYILNYFNINKQEKELCINMEKYYKHYSEICENSKVFFDRHRFKEMKS